MKNKEKHRDKNSHTSLSSGFKKKFWRYLPAILSALMAILSLYSIVVSVFNMREYAGIDLRPKVAGARALAAQIDPYIVYNNQTYSLQNNAHLWTNSFPYYTPVLLMLYVPLSNLSFTMQRLIYFCVDWSFAFAVFYFLRRYFYKEFVERCICWIVYAAFVLCSSLYWLHLERGQYYTLILLLMCLSAVSLRTENCSWLSCIPSALLILIRPTFIVIIPFALILMRRKSWAIKNVSLVGLMFLACLPVTGVKMWREYVSGIHARQDEYLGYFKMSIDGNNSNAYEAHPPMVAEGVDYPKAMISATGNGTFIGYVSWKAWIIKGYMLRAGRHIKFFNKVDCVKCVQWLNPFALLLSVLVESFVAARGRTKAVCPDVLIGFLLLCPIVIEIFGPERYGYASILEVLPLLLVLYPAQSSSKLSTWRIAALLVGGCVAPLLMTSCYIKGYFEQAHSFSMLILILLPLCLCAYSAYTIFASQDDFDNKVVLRTS